MNDPEQDQQTQGSEPMNHALWLSLESDPRPKYAEAAVERVGATMPTDGMYDVEIVHDAWCDLLTTGEACNCEPEVHPWRD